MKKLLLLALLAFAGWKGYEHLVARGGIAPDGAAAAASTDAATVSPRPLDAGAGRFRCDGRQYCSQMSSREEAEYFVRHCPGTRMDGDGDGDPCENDSRF